MEKIIAFVKEYLWTLTLAILIGVAFLFFRHGVVNSRPENMTWQSVFPELGTYSSPRLADLSGDGVLDVVIGAGKGEGAPCDSAVLALDGRDGRLLWKAAAGDQMVGSATFLDVTGDRIPEVFIGGLNGAMLALNGATGEEIWSYKTQDTVVNATGFVRFIFTCSQVIPDQNGDGTPDLLVSNGGNLKALPGQESFRYPGVLAIMDSRSGRVIAAATMPDGKETYLSPLVYDFNGDGTLSVIFGTGGISIDGSLYRIPLEDIRRGDLSGARRLAKGKGHGFIAPPALADVTADGIPDIVVNAFGGRILAINGKTDSLIWEQAFPEANASNSIAVGRFTEDDTPDFFTYFAKGPLSRKTYAVQVMIDGATGKVVYADSIGCGGMHSPLAFDANEDGFDDVLLSINDFNCDNPRFDKAVQHLRLLDLHNGRESEFTPIRYGKNVASTPWIGDLDGDKHLDLVQCTQLNNSVDFLSFFGIGLERFSLNIPVKAEPAWGGYMGSRGDGVFRKN